MSFPTATPHDKDTTAAAATADNSSSAQALAFAVAAMQALPDAEPTKMIASAVVPLQKTDDKHQTAGSGSDSMEVVPGVKNSNNGSNSCTMTSSKKKKTHGTNKRAAPIDPDDFDSLVAEDERRLQRSRERNREHARRTRLRKKEQLVVLQKKCQGLEAQKQALQAQLEDVSIASILLGLANRNVMESFDLDSFIVNDVDKNTSTKIWRPTSEGVTTTSQRKKRSGESSTTTSAYLTLDIDGVETVLCRKSSHINWKTGVYNDERGQPQCLTSEQLESLRRERNRLHAKMTRDRKKCFLRTIETRIEGLERDILQLRAKLFQTPTTTASKQGPMAKTISKVVSPELSSLPSPNDQGDDGEEASLPQPSPKRARHGFLLDD